MLRGWGGHNLVYGEAGADRLELSSGNSLLDGGPNTDMCLAQDTNILASCEVLNAG